MAAVTTTVTDDAPPYFLSRVDSLSPLGPSSPLTTEFTFLSACTSRWWYFGSDTSEIIHSGNNPIARDPTFTDCMPFGGDVFSPAICPSGLTLAAVTETQSGTVRYFDGPCCERSYTLNRTAYTCYSYIAEPVTIYVDNALLNGAPQTNVFSSSCNTISNMEPALIHDFTCKNYTVLSSVYVTANDFYIGWQESDIERFPLSYQSYLVNTAMRDLGIQLSGSSIDPGSFPSSDQSTSSASSALPGPSAPSSSHGMGPGAIAGIVIGAVAGLCLIILAVWMLLRLRRNKRSAENMKRTEANHEGHLPELPTSVITELHSTPIAPQRLAELPAEKPSGTGLGSMPIPDA